MGLVYISDSFWKHVILFITNSFYQMIELLDRNKQIVERLDSGNVSMNKLSKELGMTRQRISQIYYKTSGKIAGLFRLQKKSNSKIKKDNKLSDVKFICAGCNKSVTYKDGKHLSKYCRECHSKNKQGQRNLNITLNCETCRKEYHPFRSKQSQGNYCSRKCFHRRKT